MFSQTNFNIHKYGQKFCLNDVFSKKPKENCSFLYVVTQCEISTNPKEYIKKVDDKVLHKGDYLSSSFFNLSSKICKILYIASKYVTIS